MVMIYDIEFYNTARKYKHNDIELNGGIDVLHLPRYAEKVSTRVKKQQMKNLMRNLFVTFNAHSSTKSY